MDTDTFICCRTTPNIPKQWLARLSSPMPHFYSPHSSSAAEDMRYEIIYTLFFLSPIYVVYQLHNFQAQFYNLINIVFFLLFRALYSW